MNKLPKPNDLHGLSLTILWEIDTFIKELNKRSIECSLGVDALTETNTVSFKIRHRQKDTKTIHALLHSLFGLIKQ